MLTPTRLIIESYSATTFSTVPIYCDSNTIAPAVYAIGLQAPHWFMVIRVGAIASLPWMRCRFSLRTMLVATTLVAVGLGMVAMLIY